MGQTEPGQQGCQTEPESRKELGDYAARMGAFFAMTNNLFFHEATFKLVWGRERFFDRV